MREWEMGAEGGRKGEDSGKEALESSCPGGPQPPAGQVSLGKLIISPGFLFPLTSVLCGNSGLGGRTGIPGMATKGQGSAREPGPQTWASSPTWGSHTSATGIDGKSLSWPHVNDTN